MNIKMKTLVTVSLILNVLLLGAVAGHIYKGWASHPWHKTKADLLPENRNVVGRIFQSSFREIKPLGDEARKARAEMVKLLSAEEFDEEAFDKVAARMDDVRNDISALKIQATKDVAKVLSVEERRKMADRMAYMVGGGHERKVKRDRKPRIMFKRPEPKPTDLQTEE